jgi:hypothetical protein
MEDMHVKALEAFNSAAPAHGSDAQLLRVTTLRLMCGRQTHTVPFGPHVDRYAHQLFNNPRRINTSISASNNSIVKQRSRARLRCR